VLRITRQVDRLFLRKAATCDTACALPGRGYRIDTAFRQSFRASAIVDAMLNLTAAKAGMGNPRNTQKASTKKSIQAPMYASDHVEYAPRQNTKKEFEPT